MNKEKGMKKCTPLFGNFVKRNDAYIDALNADIKEATVKFKNRMYDLHIASEMNRLDKKMTKLQEKISYWEDTPDSFTFILESLN